MQRIDKVEFKKQLEERTKNFAIAVFKLLDALPKKNSSRVIAYQLGKSASSIGANYREANHAESRDDFSHKISISVKEAAESGYWFDILSGMYPMHETIKNLSGECRQLVALFQSISKSSRTTRKEVPNVSSN